MHDARTFLEGEQACFGVAVGIVDGPGFWEPDRRLRPAIGSAAWPLPLLHADGLLWLAALSAEEQLFSLRAPGAVR